MTRLSGAPRRAGFPAAGPPPGQAASRTAEGAPADGTPSGVELPVAVWEALAAAFPLTGAGDVVRAGPVARPGRMSDSARLLVGRPDGRPRAVFAKWPSPSVRIRRTARHSGAYQREVMFYRELAGACGSVPPAVHHSAYDPVSGAFVLLLEDVSTARPGDSRAGGTADVRRVLAAVARLHARWSLGRLPDRPWLPTWTSPTTRRCVRFELDRIARAAALGRFDGGPLTALLPLLADLRDRLGAHLERAAATPQTLVHGDLHLDQVLMPADGDPVIVDWQLAQRGGVGVDVARLLVLSLSAEERRQHENALLESYRAESARHGGPERDSGTLLDEYRFGIVWSAFVNASHWLADSPGSPGSRGSPGSPDTGSGQKGGFHDVMSGRIREAAVDHGLLKS